MLTTDDIAKFYADVEALGLKFPVAAISKATKFSKGTVSEYLSKKQDPSENFIKAFYREFKNSLKNVPREVENVFEESPGYLKKAMSETAGQDYINKRRALKGTAGPHTAAMVPAKAQAGYVRSYDQVEFLNTLEQYALPPGINPAGAVWRYFEIDGESMEPTFQSHDVVLASQVPVDDWQNIRNFYIYVLITEATVLIKRIFRKTAAKWVLISDNEKEYPQRLLSVDDIKELWVFRRHINSKAPPPKKFEIKV